MLQENPGVWRCLAHDPDSDTWRAALAMGAKLPCRLPLTLDELWNLASGTPISHQTARLLLHDTSVSAALASNPTCPPDVLVELCARTRDDIQLIAALESNPAVPEEGLRKFPGDEADNAYLLHHPNCPQERLTIDAPTGHLGLVAAHPKASAETLQEILQSPRAKPDVRKKAVDNDRCPVEALRQAAILDPDPEVRQVALDHLLDLGLDVDASAAV